MKLQAFSIFDKAVMAFTPPFFARSSGEAMRSFTDLANDPKTNVGTHPSDFILFHCGEFDDGAGLFISMEPKRVIGAYEVMVDHVSPARANGDGIRPLDGMANPFKSMDRPD